MRPSAAAVAVKNTGCFAMKAICLSVSASVNSAMALLRVGSEPISASLRDLTDFVHCVVGKSGNIDIFLRLASSRSEEHTSELQSLMRISYAVFFLKKTNNTTKKKSISSSCHRHIVYI